jgi:hypothetical protein
VAAEEKGRPVSHRRSSGLTDSAAACRFRTGFRSRIPVTLEYTPSASQGEEAIPLPASGGEP